MKTDSLVVHADCQPMEGIADPLPNQIYRNPRISIEQRELGPLSDNDVRIEMLYAGICGTDVHLSRQNPDTGYILTTAPLSIPPQGRVIGHEGVGRAIAVGNNVKHVKPGDYLTFESIVVCGYCDMCRKGRFNQCRHAILLGLEKDGLFSTAADIPGSLAHRIDDLIDSDSDLHALACIEPASVAYVACQNARMSGGDKVVVFGGGPIGLFCAILARTVFGASEVRVVEPVPFRRRFAEQWCDTSLDIAEFFDSPPDFVDVVLEATGKMENVNRIFKRINAGGRVVVLARSGESLTVDATDHMITNAISIVGSRGHLCGAFTDLISLYRRKRVPLGATITSVSTGLSSLKDLLGNSDEVLNDNCKILVKLS